MGRLVDGRWHDEWYDTESTGGKFQRSEASWRNWVTADGSAGPSGVTWICARDGGSWDGWAALDSSIDRMRNACKPFDPGVTSQTTRAPS